MDEAGWEGVSLGRPEVREVGSQLGLGRPGGTSALTLPRALCGWLWRGRRTGGGIEEGAGMLHCIAFRWGLRSVVSVRK